MRINICEICRSTAPSRAPSVHLLKKWRLIRDFFTSDGNVPSRYDFCAHCFNKIVEACCQEDKREVKEGK